MKSLWLVVALGCGGAPRSPPSHRAPAGADLPPATFAALFHKGRAWTFPTETLAVVGGATERKTSLLTCTVDDATTDAASRIWTSSISCNYAWDHPTTSSPIVYGPFGALLATADGLWRGDAGRPTPEYHLIDARPRALREERVGMDDTRTVRFVEPFEGGWCYGHASTFLETRYGATVCLRDGDLIGGSNYSSDGSEIRRARYGHAPPIRER